MLLPTPSVPDFHFAGEPDHPPVRPQVSRRQVLAGAVAAAGAAIIVPFGAVAQTARPSPTPNQTIGPFYPVDADADQDADMTVLGNSKKLAEGTIIYVSGRVLGPDGKPVANATLDIWQANAAGRYAHPADTNKAPLDANFQGFARIRTAADGSYKFKSIKPGAYPTGDGDWSRPPHIHFDVRGAKSRIITQMYFAGEPLNEKDRLLNNIRRKETVVAKVDAAHAGAEKGALGVQWDVVLISG